MWLTGQEIEGDCIGARDSRGEGKGLKIPVDHRLRLVWTRDHVSGFIAQLVRASHRYREVTVQTPLKSWLFQASLRSCLNCVHNCDDHGLPDFKSTVQYMKHFIYHFTLLLLLLLLLLLNKANFDGKQVNCLLSQPIESRPLRGSEVTVWKPNESIPCQESPHLSAVCILVVFPWLS